jgi:DNA-binding MarR family transcriptional regulator
MDEQVREKISDDLIALLPFYHKKIFRMQQGISGMQIAQYRTLGVLMREKGPLSMSELGRRLYISKPYMTVLVDLLIQDGYVERQPDPRDRRIINIAITRMGMRHLKQAGSLYRGTIQELLHSLDHQDLENLSSSLSTIREILSRID